MAGSGFAQCRTILVGTKNVTTELSDVGCR